MRSEPNNKGILLYKAQNIKAIVREIRLHDGIEKKELQKKTGLSFGTVSGICNELIEYGFIEEGLPPAGEIGLGRTPRTLHMRPMSRFGLCIDMHNLGEVTIVLKSFCGADAFRITWGYENPDEIDSIVERTHELFLQQIRLKEIPLKALVGMGVAIPGIFDLRTETVAECAFPQWNGVNFKQRFQERFSLPCYVDNQTNLSVSQLLASQTDAKNDVTNAVYLMVGDGLGVGVIVDGKLLRGSKGYASEICHLPLGDPALECPRCGNYGCAETELSKGGFLLKYTAEAGESPGWNEFLDRVAKGEAAAVAAVRSNGEVLAKCVCALLTLFDPDCLYISHDISSIYPLMADSVARRMGTLSGHYSSIPIVVDAAGWDAVPNGIMEMLLQKWNPFTEKDR